MAGSRFAHLENKIPFGYKELCDAISNAIDMSGRIDGAVISDEVFAPSKIEKTFEEIQEEGRMLWGDLVENNPDNYEKVMTIIENIFGQRLRLSEITPRQKDLFEEVINQMSQLK
jgi:hypothetical protein